MTVHDNLAFPLRNRGVAPSARSTARVAGDRRPCSTSTRCSTARRRGPHRRRQAEDLARPRPGALGRQRHHVRRAADRHRPAPEVGAALQAQGAAPQARPHDDLRHPRPDRGADLRRPGGGDERRRGRADRHAGRAVRAPGAHLRRPLHRLARHERAALRRRRADGAIVGGGRRSRLPRAYRACRAASGSSSACGRSSSRSADGAACPSQVAALDDSAATASSRVELAATRSSPRAGGRGDRRRAPPHSASTPAQTRHLRGRLAGDGEGRP